MHPANSMYRQTDRTDRRQLVCARHLHVELADELKLRLVATIQLDVRRQDARNNGLSMASASAPMST